MKKAFIAGFLFISILFVSIPNAGAATIAELQAQINALMAQITVLQKEQGITTAQSRVMNSQQIPTGADTITGSDSNWDLATTPTAVLNQGYKEVYTTFDKNKTWHVFYNVDRKNWTTMKTDDKSGATDWTHSNKSIDLLDDECRLIDRESSDKGCLDASIIKSMNLHTASHPLPKSSDSKGVTVWSGNGRIAQYKILYIPSSQTWSSQKIQENGITWTHSNIGVNKLAEELSFIQRDNQSRTLGEAVRTSYIDPAKVVVNTITTILVPTTDFLSLPFSGNFISQQLSSITGASKRAVNFKMGSDIDYDLANIQAYQSFLASYTSGILDASESCSNPKRIVTEVTAVACTVNGINGHKVQMRSKGDFQNSCTFGQWSDVSECTVDSGNVNAPLAKFMVGDTVKTVLGPNLNVRVSPYGTSIGLQPIGSYGKIVSGPARASRDNTNWWNVDYQAGVDGWSIEDALEKVSVPIPNIPTTLVLPKTPTNVEVSTGSQCGGQIQISWIGVANATGYKVYKDNQTNLISNSPATLSESGRYVFLDTKNIPDSSHSYYVSAYNSIGGSIAIGSGNAVNASSACTSSTIPTVSLSINSSFGSGSNTVTAGSYKMLDWSSTNATLCIASGGWSGTKTTSGSLSVGPINQTTTYTVTCSGAGGSNSGSVTITVNSVGTQSCDMPITESQNVSCPTGQTGSITQTRTKSSYPSCTFGTWTNTSNTCVTTPAPVPGVSLSINPSYNFGSPIVSPGTSSVLDWSATNATSCSAPWLSYTNSLSGSQTVGPVYQTTTYTLTCTGSGGTNSASLTINVLAPTQTVPTAPTGLTATAGTCGTGVINLSWGPVSNVINYLIYGGNNAYYGGMPLQASVNGTSYTDNGATSASAGFTPGNAYSYYVTARNSVGESSPSNTVSATAPVNCISNDVDPAIPTSGSSGDLPMAYNGQTNYASVYESLRILLQQLSGQLGN